jgi:MoaA/NifB/PqqE/SkfB family radical SAM enzyme
VDCFDHVIESIQIARRLGEHPDILFTVSDANVHHLPAIYDLSRSHGLILMLNPIFEYFREESLHREALDAMERFGRKKMVYLNPSFLSLRRRGGNDTERPLCRAVSRVIVISPDNQVLLPCWHFYNESVCADEGLETAWRSPRVAWHAAHQGRHVFCKGCAINCYFEPSFAFPVNGPSLASVPSKIRYGFHKLIRQRIFGGRPVQ